MTTHLSVLNDASKPISQLQTAEKLSAGDLFIVEKARFPIYQEEHLSQTFEQEIAGDIVDAILLEIGVEPEAANRQVLYSEMLGDVLGYINSNGKIRYDQLSSRIFEDLSNAFNFNTMAFKDTWEYSKVNHQHKDYSDTRCFSKYTADEVFQQGAKTTKLATWNIKHCYNYGIDKIADVLKSVKANYYCLQEVDNGTTRSGGKNQLEELAAKLGPSWKFTFTKAFDYQNGEYGLGMLYTDANPISHQYQISPVIDGDEQRIVQALEFQDFVIANVHAPGLGTTSQKIQIANSILNSLKTFLDSSKMVWLLGDLNNRPNNELVETLKTRFTVVSTTQKSTVVGDDRVFDYVLLDTKHASDKNRRFESQIILAASDASNHYPVEVQMSDITDQWLGDFTVWQLSNGEYISTEVPIYIPVISFDPYEAPDIGEVRFLGWKNEITATALDSPVRVSSYSGTTLVADDTTSGWWCYCDGQTLTCETETFKDACQMFAGNANAQQFTIPSFNNFIVPNPRTNTSSPCGFVNYENGLVSHQHQIYQPPSSDEYSLKGSITIKTYDGGAYQGETGIYVHAGSGDKITSTMTKLSCTLNSPETSLSTSSGETSEEGEDIESKPKHNKLLAITYLGRF